MSIRPAASRMPEDSFVITVRAKTRSSLSSLETDASGMWVARLRASPVDGKANAELVALVAKHFGCPRSNVSVISGATARLKLVRIAGIAATCEAPKSVSASTRGTGRRER